MSKENCPCNFQEKSLKQILDCPDYYTGRAKKCYKSSAMKEGAGHTTTLVDGTMGKPSHEAPQRVTIGKGTIVR